MMPRVGLGMLLVALGSLAWYCSGEKWEPARIVHIPEMTMTASYEYEKADEADADVVLLVTYPTHAFAEPRTWRFPLKHNPNATVSGMKWYSCRWTGCGGTGGGGGGLSITGDYQQKGTTRVALDLYERRGDGSTREVRGELEVPWMGRAVRDLPHGYWVGARFVKPQ